MPTIQFRTDDQTKAASTALFDRLGITMSEAINLFLQALWGLGSIVEPRITLYEEAVKVRLKFKDREFVIDYNFEEPETVFILSRQDGKLFAKDCALADIERTLGLF
jgi:antitoxin component of RelBE/YafQ-DinJ toxin-antitoxin module